MRVAGGTTVRDVFSKPVRVERGALRPGLVPDAGWWLVLAAAVVAWLLAVRQIDLDALGNWGMLGVLSPAWYLSVAVLMFAFGLHVVRPLPSPWILGSLIGALVLILYGTQPLSEGTARYAWSYKHIGVARYIAERGTVDPSVDIYHRWPGFFAAVATLSEATGVGVFQLARGAELFFALLNAVLVAALARTLSSDLRVVATSSLLFSLGNYVGQGYFAPQAIAFTMGLTSVLVALRFLGEAPNRLGRTAQRWVAALVRQRDRADQGTGDDRVLAHPLGAALVAVVVVLGGGVVTAVGLATEAGTSPLRNLLVSLVLALLLSVGYAALRTVTPRHLLRTVSGHRLGAAIVAAVVVFGGAVVTAAQLETEAGARPLPNLLVSLVLALLAGVGYAVLRVAVAGRRGTPDPVEQRTHARHDGRRRRIAIVVVLLLHAAVVVSHQLTPYMILAGLGLLFVIGRLRPMAVVVALLAITLLYLLPNLDFVAQNFGIFTGANPLENVALGSSTDPLLAEKRLRNQVSLTLLLTMLALGAAGLVLIARRAAGQALTVGCLLVSPASLLLSQNYGGEARHRVYLFMLPWIAFAAASLVLRATTVRRTAPRRVASAVAMTAVGSVTAMFVVSSFGDEDLAYMPPLEVAGFEALYSTAAPGTVFVMAAPGSPTQLSARYPLTIADGGTTPALSEVPDLDIAEVDDAQLDTRIDGYLRDLEPRDSLLVFSARQERYAQVYDVVGSGGLARVEEAVHSSSLFEQVFDNGDVRAYRSID